MVSLPAEVLDGLITAARAFDELVDRLHGQFLTFREMTQDELADLFVSADQMNKIVMVLSEYLATD